MKKYIVSSIVKIAGEDNKAIVKYSRGKSEVSTYREVYNVDGVEMINFKGIKVKVKFNQHGVGVNAEMKEVYDKKILATEGEKRFEKFSFELNGNSIVENIKKVAPIPQPQKVVIKNDGAVKHKKFEEIKVCVENSIPVYLYGPAGSGKNHVLQQIAEELGLDFYFTNSVQQEYKLTGFVDANGTFHETEFYRAWVNGGLFFLDEMDASIPEVLVLLNAALANGYFDFPSKGKLDAHPQFRVVSAGNTVGTGADEQYSGRLQLDQATLDRFIFIEFDYDQNIELAISKGNWELVNFIRDLRKQASEKGINATFSYRCITMVTKLEGKLQLKEVIKMAVVKGMDKDTVSTLQTTASNKYSKALWMLAQDVKKGA